MFNFFRKPQPQVGPKLPTPEDDYDRNILGDIEKTGWSVAQINPDAPNAQPFYSFSVGLYHSYQHPEIILLGLPHNVAGPVINKIGGYIKLLKKKVEPDRVCSDFLTTGCVFKLVDPRHYQTYLGYNRWLYGGNNFPMLQCVWPLKSGLYPWDKGYPPQGAQYQPFLGASS